MAVKISASLIVDQLQAKGFEYFAGVPCSFLTPLINTVMTKAGPSYIRTNHEGEALALSVGLWLTGKRCVTLSQNSGLGNMVNPLTSLLEPFAIPALLLLTWRGRPTIHDEPQHQLMGAVTPDLLDLMRLDWHDGGQSMFSWTDAICATDAAWSIGKRTAIVLDGDIFDAVRPVQQLPAIRQSAVTDDVRTHKPLPHRHELLACLLKQVPNTTAIIANTGVCARELLALADRPQHFYMAGSMGFSGAIALGVALGREEKVIALDGDGALLMRMGNMATIGASGQPNICHILLDNECHDSTGGQPTVSSSVNFCAVAGACGYRYTVAVDSIEGFHQALSTAAAIDGPTFLHVKVLPGSLHNLPRIDQNFPRLARRFRRFCLGDSAQ